MRTQNLLYYLAELRSEGAVPRVPIDVDSPLAIDATKAYRKHPECYDAETRALLESGTRIFSSDLVTYTRTTEESMRLNSLQEACIVISASGMCEHIQRVLADSGNNVSQAARVLGIHTRSLQRKLARRPPVI